MSRTVHGTACWECSDFNIKNTMGEECEGSKHIFCDKSLEEHDKQIRADVIDEIIEWLKTNPKYVTCISSNCSEEVNSKIIEYYEHLVQQLKELKEQNIK